MPEKGPKTPVMNGKGRIATPQVAKSRRALNVKTKRSLPRVVLLLATPKGARLGNLTIEMFFVGISRVRDGNHLRIMPCARADLDYLEKLRFCSHIRYWYNNYNQLGEWNPHRKFILPSIEPMFRKVVSSMKKNQPTHIKQYQNLAKQLGISYSGKSKTELAELLQIWIQRFNNKTLYDDNDN